MYKSLTLCYERKCLENQSECYNRCIKLLLIKRTLAGVLLFFGINSPNNYKGSGCFVCRIYNATLIGTFLTHIAENIKFYND